jgi:trehalose-6-phosphate synthase
VLDDCIKFKPWDVKEFSDAIFQALTMSEEERRLRFDKLYSFVMRNTRLAKSTEYLRYNTSSVSH